MFSNGIIVGSVAVVVVFAIIALISIKKSNIKKGFSISLVLVGIIFVLLGAYLVRMYSWRMIAYAFISIGIIVILGTSVVAKRIK